MTRARVRGGGKNRNHCCSAKNFETAAESFSKACGQRSINFVNFPNGDVWRKSRIKNKLLKDKPV
jgi:hypothetical protein